MLLDLGWFSLMGLLLVVEAAYTLEDVEVVVVVDSISAQSKQKNGRWLGAEIHSLTFWDGSLAGGNGFRVLILTAGADSAWDFVGHS